MARLAQNEMRAMRGMPLRVRSTEGLGVGLAKMKHVAFEPIGEELPLCLDATQAHDQLARRLICVVHVGFYHWPLKGAVGVIDGCLGSFSRYTCAASFGKQPPSEFTRPPKALPVATDTN